MNIYAEVNKDRNLKEYEKINKMFLCYILFSVVTNIVTNAQKTLLKGS